MGTGLAIAMALVIVAAIAAFAWYNNSQATQARLIANQPGNQLGAGVGSVISGVIGLVSAH